MIYCLKIYRSGRDIIKSAFEFMGIRALYPKVRTTLANKEHRKYPYLLKAFKNDNNLYNKVLYLLHREKLLDHLPI
jgi:hypothetical protein